MRLTLIFVFGFLLGACTADDPSAQSANPSVGSDAQGTAESPAPESSIDQTEEETGPRVVFLGTSLTAGLGLERESDGYVARVDQIADSLGFPLLAVNAGVSGETSAGGLRRIDWILREPMDVLVLELGANDGLRGQDPEALRANLLEIIARTRTRYPDVRILIAGMQAPPNFGLTYTARFGIVFSEVAEETRAALIPFLLEGVAGVPELNQDDRIHPTPEGHDLMARTVWTHLQPLLAPTGGN